MAVFPLDNRQGGFNTGYRVSASFTNTHSLSALNSTKLYSRTQGTGDSRLKMTFSFWVKSAATTDSTYITHDAGELDLLVHAGGQIFIIFNAGADGYVQSSVTVDDGAWHHVVVQVDTANATATSRVRMWKDGTEDASLTFLVTVTQNYSTQWGANTVVEHLVHQSSGNDTCKVDEISKIDNQLLTPASFATSNLPKSLSGLTFGAQGYWIRFESGVASTGGTDSSGNGLDFANTNFVDADLTTDVPT